MHLEQVVGVRHSLRSDAAGWRREGPLGSWCLTECHNDETVYGMCLCMTCDIADDVKKEGGTWVLLL